MTLQCIGVHECPDQLYFFIQSCTCIYIFGNRTQPQLEIQLWMVEIKWFIDYPSKNEVEGQGIFSPTQLMQYEAIPCGVKLYHDFLKYQKES